ncbi:hypothetical protein [Streptomyces sp. NBC_01451]|uniref:hypothetical protein n=1 Tax=Streptomyces sp. NBC_01451 TaxID=2903872 RepID=UPI002E2F3715|nr:hypothetical protein [Streptomyces sp. NBC_01451]
MTVAVMEAVVLDAMLTTTRTLDGFPRRFQCKIAQIAAWLWFLAALSDRAWQPDRATPRLVRAGQWYLNRWQQLIPNNSTLFIHYVRMMNMLSSPAALLHPALLLKILFQSRCLAPSHARPTPGPSPPPLPR